MSDIRLYVDNTPGNDHHHGPARHPVLSAGRALSIPTRCAMLAASLTMLLTACNSTMVLRANFNANTIGSPPTAAQDIGTVSLDQGAGTITVVDPPAAGLAEKWVRISHPTPISPQTAMTARFSGPGGAGRYGLLTQLFIPSDTGIVTVQFEPFSTRPDSYANFLHLDFMPEGDIRVDDGTMRFGRFPRDRAFLLTVGLDITATRATVHVRLAGAGASGSADVPINPRFLSAAMQFSAVKFWMGFEHTGSFYVDDIVVTRQNP